MTLLDRHASMSHVGSHIKVKVDPIVCGTSPAKWKMHSVTVLHVQSHTWYLECTTYGNDSPQPINSQPHWNLCSAVLELSWRLYYANDAGSYNTAACKAQKTPLEAATNCMH